MSPASSLIRIAAIAVLALAAGEPAHAEQKRGTVRADMPLPRYVRVPGAARTPGTSAVTSRIVYMKRCPVISGCTVTKGATNDSRTDTTTIAEGPLGGTRIIGEFSQGDEVWNDLMACVKKTFEPFDITVTDQDPGNVPHFMNIVGGKPTQLNSEHASAGGVAPFDCGEIPNAIVFTFDVYGPDAETLCWTSAQEVAHAFGLDHQFLQKDPMTYLDGDLPKRFRDADAPCGERDERTCSCPGRGPTQNSYRHIVGMFGPGIPTPPEVAFRRPAAQGEVQPGFKAVIEAEDDVRVEKVELYIDGALAGMTSTRIGGVYEIQAPPLGGGEHTLEARATDVQGVVGTATLVVTEGPPCTRDKGCTGTDACVDGVCVPGPDEPGGLGALCQADTECLSHRCADSGEGIKHCVETCSLDNAASCPHDFACTPAGADAVCWPAPGGGCCDAGRAAPGSLLLGLGVLLVLRRRRRR